MSVMTSGEQRRRTGATRGRPPAAGTPGQQTVTAGERRPGPATSVRRHGATGQRTRHLTVVPPPQPSKAATPAATGAVPTQGYSVPPRATGSQTVPPQAEGSPVIQSETARPETARPGAARPGARSGAVRPGAARPQGTRLTRGHAAQPGPARAGAARLETVQ